MNISILPADQVITPPQTLHGGSAVDLRGVVVVGVDGDVDIYTAPRLLQAVKDALAPCTAHRGGGGAAGLGLGAEVEVKALVVDLTEVEFIDSSAIGVLVQGHHLARRGGCGYALVATHPMIHTLFEITGLVKVLPLHPSVAAAVATLRPAASRSDN